MIIRMSRVRIAGPSALLEPALRLLQDIGDLHLIAAAAEARDDASPAAPEPKPQRQARRLLDDVEAVLAALPTGTAPLTPGAQVTPWPMVARRVRRLRRELAALARQDIALAEEEALLLQYRGFFDAFEPLLQASGGRRDLRASFVLLRSGAAAALAELRKSLQAAVGDKVEVHARELPSGETAVLMLAPAAAAAQLDALLATARLEELPAPRHLGEPDLLHALPALRARLLEVQAQCQALRQRRDAIASSQRGELQAWQASLHDLLLLAQAQAQVRAGELLFVIEGWLPAPAVAPLRTRVAHELGAEIVIVEMGTEPWTRADAPVALANPRLFRPFELITRAFPLPRYGSIDPTPFVAVFFPMFFGLMLGDLGYGVLLLGLAGVLRWRSSAGSTQRAVAEMGLACALFAIAFGLLFGEFFGTLGPAIGLHALAFEREDALVPFLLFAVALGAVHVLLGLVLAVIGAWRRGERRKALGRGLTIVMVALTALALLAALQVLPAALFTPAAIAVLVAFPVLVALEGIIAVVELMSAFGHILSYARIMALGTASLMLAMVANRMVGAMGSVLVGVAFALLFHVVNFAIGLASPTIHALRLHYVEFFGQFYSPGGAAYRPFGHWHAPPPQAAA